MAQFLRFLFLFLVLVLVRGRRGSFGSDGPLRVGPKVPLSFVNFASPPDLLFFSSFMFWGCLTFS